jgi:hypothetical protein
MTVTNAERLQAAISDDLFPTVQHISDVKQVLEFINVVGQDLSQKQVRAILYLYELGNNKELHPDGNPYLNIIDKVIAHKKDVVNPDLFIEAIEALIPKPPKPVIVANGQQVEKGGKR